MMDWYVGSEWKQESKGLTKKVTKLQFTKLEKPHAIAKIVVRVDSIKDMGGRFSKNLTEQLLGKEQQLEMGTALTPLDCYLEILLQQMLVGESAECIVRTRASDNITFVITLVKILETKEIHKLTVNEMYQLALRYKENGVAMFKEYPLFAHDYFSRAAKCLISYLPFHDLTIAADGVANDAMHTLFKQVQNNLAACLLNEERYEDVIYQTNFVESSKDPCEKSVYRRAMAYFNIKEFEASQKTIEKIPDYQNKKEFVKLHERITEGLQLSRQNYKYVMQRMFN